MREIKFRGLHKKTKTWHYGLISKRYYRSKVNFFIDTHYKSSSRFKIALISDSQTLGQYTGLEDKRGNNIYDGDIVECFLSNIKLETGALRKRGEIVFVNGCFMFKEVLRSTQEGIWEEHSQTSVLFHLAHCATVIGNIHEHPELLESPNKKERS